MTVQHDEKLTNKSPILTAHPGSPIAPSKQHHQGELAPLHPPNQIFTGLPAANDPFRVQDLSNCYPTFSLPHQQSDSPWLNSPSDKLATAPSYALHIISNHLAATTTTGPTWSPENFIIIFETGIDTLYTLHVPQTPHLLATPSCCNKKGHSHHSGLRCTIKTSKQATPLVIDNNF